MKKFLLIFLSIIAIPCFAQTEVSIYNMGGAEGITYYLPNTVLDITVETHCITRQPGEFSRYAERFLRINNAVTENKKHWELIGVKVEEKGVPCPEKMFTVKLNDNASSNIQLTESGIIEAVNTEVGEDIKEPKESKTRQRIDAKRYMTEEILQATSTAKMAELTAKEIYSIRESKMAITRGSAENMPKDGLSMQLVLDELNTQEAALTELFTGRIDTVRYTCNIKFTPSVESDTTRAVLFRFSQKLGILNNHDLAGSPIYYDFKNLETIPQPEEKEKKKKSLKKEGICYIVPGRAKVSIYTNSDILFEEELPIAQLGTIEVLSKNLFKKNNDTEVIFNTATGGIISIDK